MADNDKKNDSQEPKNQNQNDETKNESREAKGQGDSHEPQAKPPAYSETTGSPLPAKPITAKVHGKAGEAARLDRMGVKNDDNQQRGMNIVAEGHHAPDPINHPRHTKEEELQGQGEYRLNEYGDTMPAVTLHAPKMSGSAHVPGQPVAPTVPPPIVVKK